MPESSIQLVKSAEFWILIWVWSCSHGVGRLSGSDGVKFGAFLGLIRVHRGQVL